MFAKRYPDGAQGFIEQLIVGAERAKRYTDMAKIIKRYYQPQFKLSQNDNIIAEYRIYKATQGRGATGLKAAKAIEAIYGSNPGGVSGQALRYVGELAYKRVAAEPGKYASVKLKGGSLNVLAKSIETKAIALQNLKQAMGTVAISDSYWGVAALYNVANALAVCEALANPPTIKEAPTTDVIKELQLKLIKIEKKH